jgi:predicted nucleotidyltransferase
MKKPRLIPQLLEALLPYQAEQIHLFGSFARGAEDELSDVAVHPEGVCGERNQR